MIPSTMLYGLLLGLALIGWAHFLDKGLRALKMPTRWAWILAMAGTSLVPLALFLNPRGARPESALGTVIPLESLYALWENPIVVGPVVPSVTEWFNRPLGVLWVAGSLLMLGLFFGAALRLRRKSAEWPTREVDGEELLISDGLGPAVLGLLRPRIVLPPWALALEKPERELILCHEMEHREARDPALLATGIFLLSLAPWNPGLWWCLRRLRLAVEGDCDRRVLARGIPRHRYGKLLLGVASGTQQLFPLAPALTEGGGRFLERRLRMIRDNVGKKRIGGGLAAMVMGGFFLFLACETPTPPGALVETEEELQGELTEVVGEQANELTLSLDPNSSVSTGGVIVERKTADGTVEMEAGRLKLTQEGAAPDEGIKIRLNEAPEGVQRTVEESPLIYIDGVRVADGVAKTVMSELNPDLIDRIEVIKGGAAEAMFGPDAANGVVQIFMKKK